MQPGRRHAGLPLLRLFRNNIPEESFTAADVAGLLRVGELCLAVLTEEGLVSTVQVGKGLLLGVRGMCLEGDENGKVVEPSNTSVLQSVQNSNSGVTLGEVGRPDYGRRLGWVVKSTPKSAASISPPRDSPRGSELVSCQRGSCAFRSPITIVLGEMNGRRVGYSQGSSR